MERKCDMKFIRRIAHSRLINPICCVLSLMAVVYIGFAVKNIAEQTPILQRVLSMPVTEEITQQTEQDTEPMQDAYETYTQREEILLPEAVPEQAPSEAESAPLPEQSVQQENTKPPQATRPEEQKPTEQMTTKPLQTTAKPPVSTQKPAQTTKPPSAPISAWSVTYKQAKSMVRANSAYDYEDLYWLSRIISAEAKGESFTGQIGVGTVVLNRVRSKEFPSTVKGVVFDQKYGTQFTPVANGTIYQTPTDSAVVAAKMCLDGYTLSDSVLYFLNPRIATSSWIQNHRKYAFRVGNHDFYH
ncbi:MAG: cell wall hydrolase [Clostridia bacterium]|nr:cell wall hydrolase [Clostridia bacterium]MBO7296019.1 cell wall hydrolase [Clostridia bacterium]